MTICMKKRNGESERIMKSNVKNVIVESLLLFLVRNLLLTLSFVFSVDSSFQVLSIEIA